MSLPNPGQNFTPGTDVPAADLDDTQENLEALSAGTGFNDDVFDFGHVDPDGGIWWEELGRHTLSSSAAVMEVTNIPARRFLRVIVYNKATGGTVRQCVVFNNDTGANYAFEAAENGAAGSSLGSANLILLSTGSANANPNLTTIDIRNDVGVEKQLFASTTGAGTAGAGNAPVRRKVVGKWANTTDQITEIDIRNASGTGNFDAGSEMIVLGHN